MKRKAIGWFSESLDKQYQSKQKCEAEHGRCYEVPYAPDGSISPDYCEVQEIEYDDHDKPIYELADKEEVEVDEELIEQCPEGYHEVEGEVKACRKLVGYEKKFVKECVFVQAKQDAWKDRFQLRDEEQELMNFLANTDYLVIREAETDTPYDESIKTQRQEARNRISEIRDALKQHPTNN